MAPKKGAKDVPTGPPLPVLDEEVVVPEAIGPVPDPPFVFALVHAAGAPFGVESVSAAGGDAPVLKVVDPCQLILAKFKADPPQDDPVSRAVVPVDREELEALAANEGGSLAKALRVKAERESAARRRRKVNAARRNAIAAGGAAAGEAHEQSQDGSGEADFTLLVVGYPSTAGELEEVCAEGIFELPAAWVSVFLAAESVVEEPGYDANSVQAGAPPERSRVAVAPPACLTHLFDAIHTAELGTGLANSTICDLRDCHLLVPAHAGEAEDPAAWGAPLLEGVLREAGAEVARRLRFTKWLEAVDQRVEIREHVPPMDMQVYDRLASSVDPAHQDVALLLYCLCEQVAADLGGPPHATSGGRPPAPDAKQQEELESLNAFLEQSHDQLLLGELPGIGFGVPSAAGGRETPAQAEPPAVSQWRAPQHMAEEAADEGLVLPYLDRVSRRHVGDELPGAVPATGEVLRLLEQLGLPGTRRNGFPATSSCTPAERSALQNRFYSFMPSYPIAEIERMLVLHEFERLLEDSQPERTWCLKDRVCQERIPGPLLAQVLLEALREEYLLDTRYDHRRDCLLIAMHRRAPPGRVLWHGWSGDLLAGEGRSAGSTLCPEPTYNDWCRLVASEAADGVPGLRPSNPSPSRLLKFDARDMGYCRIVEKAVVPADGSTVLSTRLQRGLAATFPRLVAGPRDAYEAPPKSELRCTRVTKDGVSFGMLADEVWAARTEDFRRLREVRERAAAERAAAAAAAAAAREEVEALRRAQGLPASEEDPEPVPVETAPEDEVPDSLTARRLEDMVLGRFWATFADGARCSARIHHERPWYAEGAIYCDDAVRQPGAIFVYSPVSGFVVQVLSDGTVCLVRPPQARRAEVANWLAGGGPGAGGGALPAPGGPGDVEVMRTVTPGGVVTRELLSGRREVYHADGARALRNPSVSEVRERLLRYRDCGAAEEAACLDALFRSYSELHAKPPASKAAFLKLKAAGLPGHWLVTRPDGMVFGRTALPAMTEAIAAGQDDPIIALQETLEGGLVDGGAILEYEVGPSAASLVLDAHTGQRVITNGDGLMRIEDPVTASQSLVLPDGTRVWCNGLGAWTVDHGGLLAGVECQTAGDVAKMLVSCDDGAQLEVVAQRADLRPRGASVLLRRRDGALLHSTGVGEVAVVTPSLALSLGEEEALRAAAARQPWTYLAHLDGAKICMSDQEGNEVEVRGDQSVRCRLAGEPRGLDAPASPRCTEPGRAYSRPDASSLPLPAQAPPPRLFVVYGATGDAEELLEGASVREALQLARRDPDAVVVEGESMGSAMPRCRAHSIYRTSTTGAQRAPSRGAPLPPCVAGLPGPLAAVPGRPSRTVTELRQFVEFPPISDQERAAFLAARARFDAREAALRSEADAEAARGTTVRKAKHADPAEGGA